MTAVEKRKVLEAIDFCVRNDLLTELEAKQVMRICYTAAERTIREAGLRRDDTD